MKTILCKTLLSTILLTTLGWTADITSWKSNYDTNSDIWIELKDKPGNAQDWIGIYKAGSDNSWSNVIKWRWAKDTTPTQVDKGDWYKFHLDDGKYEARFFLNNSFTVEESIAFSVGEQNSEPSIKLSKSIYQENEKLSINLDNLPSNNGDWVGVYAKGASNDWGNVLRWSYTNGTKSMNKDGIEKGTLILDGLDVGEYEARLFYNNTFELVKKVGFKVTAGNQYGEVGDHNVSTYTERENENVTVYYPSDIGDMPKMPLIFFCSGFGSKDHNDYKSLLTFIASHGYSVIYAKDYYGNPKTFIKRFEKILDEGNKVLPYVDTTRIGVIGHSSGGGDTFRILDYFSAKGYGKNGRFLMALDPWFAVDMTSDKMRKLPSNTNVLIQRYDNVNRTNNETDARIPLSEYALLDSINSRQKDYQIYVPATHSYPKGQRSYLKMQGLLRPLDALMAYTFENDVNAHDIALENGSDYPYGDGIETVRAIEDYEYGCNTHLNKDEVLEIQYCHQYLEEK